MDKGGLAVSRATLGALLEGIGTKSSESIELRGLISSRQFALPLASASTNIRKILSRESEATCSALVLTWIERGLAPRDSSAATTSSRSSLTAAMSAHLYSPLLNLTLAP